MMTYNGYCLMIIEALKTKIKTDKWNTKRFALKGACWPKSLLVILKSSNKTANIPYDQRDRPMVKILGHALHIKGVHNIMGMHSGKLTSKCTMDLERFIAMRPMACRRSTPSPGQQQHRQHTIATEML